MKRSMLESYEDILSVLVKEASAVDRLSFETNMDCSSIRQRLHFLMKHELVQERRLGKKAIYATTERGVAVLRALNFQKYLEKIKDNISAIDEAMQIVPIVTEEEEVSDKEDQ